MARTKQTARKTTGGRAPKKMPLVKAPPVKAVTVKAVTVKKTTNAEIRKMKIADLRKLAKNRGLDDGGTRPELVNRLVEKKAEGASAMTVKEIQDALRKEGLLTSGKKDVLANRLEAHRSGKKATPAKRKAVAKKTATTKTSSGMTKKEAMKFMDAFIEIGLMDHFPRDSNPHSMPVTKEWAFEYAYALVKGDKATIEKLDAMVW